MRNEQRGSIWRKWDFHFHTQSSFDHDYKSGTDDNLIKTLLDAEVAAVVVSDHHKIDIPRIRNLQALAANRLVIFPGIELRSELGGGESVHFIGIFPEDSDLEDLWDNLKVKLEISAKQVAEKTDERVYVPFTKGADVIHKLGGLVSVHAGNKSNSIERIKNICKFKQAVKADLARDHVDIFEVGSTKDTRGYQDKVFPSLGFSLPLVLGSDNHDFRNYEQKEKCWIKADVTFNGLRHVLHEPEDRIFLGDIPPSVARVNGNRTRYMRSVSFARRTDSKLIEAWFDGELLLHHGLVAIIGNKGSGKSALADILGLLGDSPYGDSFSFLNPEKFRLAKANKAQHFEAELTWESGGTVKKCLDDDVDISALESVKYVPQAYLEKICNELGTGAHSRFSQELKSVIFSHIDQADRLGYDDLDGLLGYRTKETAASIALLRADLRTAIRDVVRIEEKLSARHQKSLHNQLVMKKRELASHEANKPKEPKKPEADPATREKTAEIEKAVAELQKKLTEFDEQVRTLTKQRATLAKKVASADVLLGRIENFATQHQTFRSESMSDIALLGLNIDSLVKVQIDVKPIEQAKADAAEQLETVTKALSTDDSESEIAKKTAIEEDIKKRRAELDRPQQDFQKYLNAVQAWTTKRQEIIGDADTTDTLTYIEAQVESLKTLPKEHEIARGLCMRTALSIYEKVYALAEDYRKVYGPVQQFINEHPLAKDRFEMQFEAAIVASGFEDGFLSHINQGRKGSYCGQEDGAQRIRQAVREADLNTASGIKAFLNGVEESLSRDLRKSDHEAMSLDQQLRKEVTSSQLYEYLFSLDYLKPHYTLRWAGKDVEQLSPGERGTLLLVFYLLIDRSDKPLVMDQPEENLDNQTVYDILVPAIKLAKTRRQIIIVTHNPNLAVVCDSDQIIHAALDKDGGNNITYTSGAIENPIINQKVIDVLEGTRPAFHNREVKYHASVCEPESRAAKDASC